MEIELKKKKKRAAGDGNGVGAAEHEIERKKKKEMKVGFVRFGSLPHLPIELAFEVLTRLSIKDLFKCMPLSKAWRSTILDHPGFPDAYRRHNSRVLVVSVCSDKDERRRFYYSSVGDDEEFVLTSTVSGPNNNDAWFGATQVVDGLVCLYDESDSVAVYLYNTLTGEAMKLPHPPYPVDEKGEDLRRFEAFFSFGFDPINSEYKLLRMVFNDGYNDGYTQAYILTLGAHSSSWRKLPTGSFPMDDNGPERAGIAVEREGFLVNGVIYWKTWLQYLISFNLSEEVFSLIPTPDEIGSLTFYYFAQFRGQLSLIPGELLYGDSEKLILYMLDYSRERGYFWTRHETRLPSGLRTTKSNKRRFCKRRAVPVGSLPTGEILLADGYSGDTFTRVYSYNYCEDEEEKTKKSIFKRLTIGKMPESLDLLMLIESACTAFFMSSVEPNFGTLHSMIHRGRDIR